MAPIVAHGPGPSWIAIAGPPGPTVGGTSWRVTDPTRPTTEVIGRACATALAR